MNTCTSPSPSSNTAPTPPTSDPLKLFMEDIEKSQTLTLHGKYVKIHMYLVSLKEEMGKIKDLGLPNSKRILDHAIKTLEVEHDSVSEKLKNVTNQTGVTNVGVFPKEMIRVSQKPSLNPTNTVLQAPQISMQSQQGTWHRGLGQQGSVQAIMQQQRYQMLQLHLARRQQEQQQQGLLQPQVMKPSQLQQQMIQQQQQMIQQQQQIRQAQMQQLLQPQIMKLNPTINEQSQLQQHRELLQQLGQQVFGQQE
ncbi:unnamed protein product [Brassica rapa]|uniref:Uncharacterized protein n=2 Tax=Brassica campestris TaxID=3711 RepID=A0A8D9GCA6_BRACM|nr:unnamed protein product [Brassica rapa]